MANVLIVAEQITGGGLRKATFNALGAGRTLAGRTGGKLHILVMGKGLASIAEELKGYGDVHVADAAELEQYLAETYAPVVAEVAKSVQAVYVGVAATSFGKDLLPRVACRLQSAMATEILGFGGSGAQVSFMRPMWAGNVIAEVDLTTPIKCFSVRPTEFAPAAKDQSGSVAAVAAKVDTNVKARFVKFEEVKSSRPELTEAAIVVSGGRGTKGDFNEINGLADDVGAAVGATRAAVDAGWVPNDLQIGQTGKVVAPQLYVAAGISGAIQHLAGMKGSKVIVAINKDAEAPIFALADYGLVGDLFKAIPELRAKIKSSK